MRHNYLRNDTSGDHYAVGRSELPHGSGLVLAQLQSAGEQVRVSMTPEQAVQFAHDLLTQALHLRSNVTAIPSTEITP